MMARKLVSSRIPSRSSTRIAKKKKKRAPKATEPVKPTKSAKTASRQQMKYVTRPKPQRCGKLSFLDRISRLTFHTACKLLGEEGETLIRRGGTRFDNIHPSEDVYLSSDLLRVSIKDPNSRDGQAAQVTLTGMSSAKGGIQINCDQCDVPCEHMGAALSFILEERQLLGLAVVPDENVALEHLTDQELIERALAERQRRAREERMSLRSVDPKEPWTDYTITSELSGKTYRVALRGTQLGESYCSCPDFRINHLGTCKHILHAIDKLSGRFSKQRLAKPYKRKNLSLRLDYGPIMGLRFNLPSKPLPDQVQKNIGPLGEGPLCDAQQVVDCIHRLQQLGHDVHIYPDAENYIDQQLLQKRLERYTAEIRANPAKHPLRRELLKVELLPYQLDGIAFAVGAARAVLADDMGLGKTIQGVGMAELLAQLVGIRRVLVVCPASLKSQWRSEIHRFCERSCQLVAGNAIERIDQYRSDTFFTVCNYEQVLRDIDTIETIPWDLIILDEGQRIKNWEAKTTRTVKGLRSRFALVLSGTPLENHLGELYSVVSFIDNRRLGPAYRFFHQHRIVGDDGKIIGFKNLDQLRTNLRPILLRRTRGGVMHELPERTTEIVRIRPTAEQQEIHDAALKNVALLLQKKYFTEMDLIRLRQLLLIARMSADSSFLVNKEEPEYSTKLDRLYELLEQLIEESDRKIVLFSEWTTMLNRIEKRIEPLHFRYVRLDGNVPQKKRAAIVHDFQTHPDYRMIIMSNAGATGLNLQAANTVVNVDLPWNPAVLEQRIGRAHRMGQKRPVQVYLLVTEGMIEEKLLGTLAAKQDLAIAALDVESKINRVELETGIEELKRRLERLLGQQPAAPVDLSLQQRVEQETIEQHRRRERVAAAGGQLLGAAFQLLGELVVDDERPEPDSATISRIRRGLDECIQRDPSGRPRLSITLADDRELESLARTLARLLVAG
ncbi:MAG: DEAD/DEAH box helicase [Pirellulales bacterium]|nr:DEAD/DEAH box helicase [Pirellulales bacterium]